MKGVTFSPKGKRKLSSFLGRELLYDYVTDQLDDQRKQSVEEYLQTQKEGSGDLQKIKTGMIYASSLQQTEISEEFCQRILAEHSYSETLVSKVRFHDWPEGLKFGLKILSVSASVVFLGLIIPWTKFSNLSFQFSGPVVLTEVSKTETVADVSSDSTLKVAPPEPAPYLDEGAPKKAAQPETSPVKVAQIPTTTTPVVAVAPAIKDEKKPAATVGALFRGSVAITNSQAIAPKLIQRLEELGGRKAGEVPLGWKKGNGSYFHFTIPVSLFEKVKSLFGEYGKLHLTKEKHERIMPEGIVRIIITVDEDKK